MKLLKQVVLIPLLLVVAGASAASDDLGYVAAQIAAMLKAGERPLLPDEVSTPTIYSGAAITTGAGAKVGGGVRAYQAVTLGASSSVGDALRAGAGVTVGAGASVATFLTASDGATTGADARVGGRVVAGNAIVFGAFSMIGAEAIAGTSVTLGDSTIVDGDVIGSTIFVDLIGASRVKGDADERTGVVSAGTRVHESTTSIVESGIVIQDEITPFTRPPQVDYKVQILAAADALRDLPITEPILPAVISGVRTLVPGVYNAPALTTAASTIITLDGQNSGEPERWVFNIDTYLSLGASTKVKMIRAHPDSAVVWNMGGYAQLGASSELTGSIIAGSYVTTGDSATIEGVAIGDETGEKRCGGIITHTGAVTLGANSVVGGDGCLTCSVNKFILNFQGEAVFDSTADCSLDPPPVEDVCADDEYRTFDGGCGSRLQTKKAGYD
jgi:hypothetical protein